MSQNTNYVCIYLRNCSILIYLNITSENSLYGQIWLASITLRIFSRPVNFILKASIMKNTFKSFLTWKPSVASKQIFLVTVCCLSNKIEIEFKGFVNVSCRNYVWFWLKLLKIWGGQTRKAKKTLIVGQDIQKAETYVCHISVLETLPCIFQLALVLSKLVFERALEDRHFNLNYHYYQKNKTGQRTAKNKKS